MALNPPPRVSQTRPLQPNSSPFDEKHIYTYKYITELPQYDDTLAFLKNHPKIGDNVFFYFNYTGYYPKGEMLLCMYRGKYIEIPSRFLSNFERVFSPNQESRSSIGGKRKKCNRYTCKQKRRNTRCRKSLRKRKNKR
jgi:hypothetical protein